MLQLAHRANSLLSLHIRTHPRPFRPASVRLAFAGMSTRTDSLPSKMRAIQINRNGGVEVIEQHEVDVPKPGKGQILLKVHYSGVNFIDTYHRSGLYKVEFPYTLGQEAAGQVMALGEGVSEEGLKVGDRAAAYSPNCFAEYVVVSRAKATKIPEQVDDSLAVAACVQGLTAWTLVREAYPVQRGDWVLVHAAAGGTGLLLCQMANHLGAHVIGTTSSAAKAEEARNNGAEHVIISSEENVVDRVMELTNGNGVHAIFDGVGKATWEDDYKMIARKGTIASFGNASGAVEPFSLTKLVPKNVKLLRPTVGNYVYTQEEMEKACGEVLGLARDGTVKFKIHGEYPLTAEAIQQAQTDITSRKTSGKLLVKVA